MFYKIKGFRHIHTAGEHIRAIPHEVADSLDHTPSAHCGGAARLICKLELIQAKRISKEYQDNPVKQLQHQATDCNWSIILATACITQFIFDNWYQCCQEKEQGEMAMN